MSIEEITQELETANASLSTVTAELEAAKAIIAAQKNELETAQNAAKETLANLETANAENTELSAKLETLTAENEALTKERDEAKIEAAKAREQGARYGAKAPAGGTASNGPKEFTTSAQIKEHYATLTGEERFAFFQKNKKTLLS